jgi:hypothetical protein
MQPGMLRRVMLGPAGMAARCSPQHQLVTPLPSALPNHCLIMCWPSPFGIERLCAESEAKPSATAAAVDDSAAASSSHTSKQPKPYPASLDDARFK